MDTANRPILEMKNILKVYGNGIVANKNVNFSVNPGEIHGLLGENGAGKTTLMKILYGIDTCEEGDIILNGKKAVISSPSDALALGIGMVHQHFMLLESLSVAENILLGTEPSTVLNTKQLVDICTGFTKKFNFDIDCSKKINSVSVGVKQKVEIVKALYKGVKILVLDEPTAILTPQETKELFTQLTKLKESGITIIFISHKLDEIKLLCDRISIMRQGRSIGTYVVKDISKEQISNLMVGRDVVLKVDKHEASPKEAALSIRGLQVRSKFGKPAVNGVSFDVRKGEILGVAGVEGNGQPELINAIAGLAAYTGEIKINNRSIKGYSIKQVRDLNVGHIPEDRMESGIAKNLSIKENMLVNLVNGKGFSKGLFLDYKAIDKYVEKLVADYQIVCGSIEQEVGMLSGGNIQKVVVARELKDNLCLLLANQPTRGVDVGAAEFIRKKIIEARDTGAAVLLVSADLNEIFEVCDSLIVMYKGKIAAYFKDIKELTEVELGEYMLGVKTQHNVEGVLYA